MEQDKREKVIKGLECCINNERSTPDCMRCSYAEINGICIGLHKLHGDALALLKAQEPVKPARYQEGRWFKTWRCGACGGTLVFRNGEDKPKYCTDCGREVKWE